MTGRRSFQGLGRRAGIHGHQRNVGCRISVMISLDKEYKVQYIETPARPQRLVPNCRQTGGRVAGPCKAVRFGLLPKLYRQTNQRE